MTEPTRSLRAVLDELHAVLEASPDLGSEGRDALRQAVADIQAALDAPGAERSSLLSDQLSQALERFEGAHPKLTQIVGRVADALADLGI